MDALLVGAEVVLPPALGHLGSQQPLANSGAWASSVVLGRSTYEGLLLRLSLRRAGYPSPGKGR